WVRHDWSDGDVNISVGVSVVSSSPYHATSHENGRPMRKLGILRPDRWESVIRLPRRARGAAGSDPFGASRGADTIPGSDRVRGFATLGSAAASGLARRVAGALAAIALLPATALTLAVATAPAAAADTSQFRGVNWAVFGDNFSTGPLVIDGLSSSDSYDTVYAKADVVYDQMESLLG